MEPIPQASGPYQASRPCLRAGPDGGAAAGPALPWPERFLLGLLLEGENLAARVLVAHGLDLETVRAQVDQLIKQGHSQLRIAAPFAV